jgi:hypothetical protein
MSSLPGDFANRRWVMMIPYKTAAAAQTSATTTPYSVKKLVKFRSSGWVLSGAGVYM